MENNDGYIDPERNQSHSCRNFYIFRAFKLFLFFCLSYYVLLGIEIFAPSFVCFSERSCKTKFVLSHLHIPRGKLGVALVTPPSMHSNRFYNPWYLPPRTSLLSLRQSRYRILYSPVREFTHDGIGHGFNIMNAEVGAAIRLNLTYTHRKAQYGPLTRHDRNAVRNFFGWGYGSIDRSRVRETFCSSSFVSKYHADWMRCQTCESVHYNSTWPLAHIQRLVEIPKNITYNRVLHECHGRNARLCESETNMFIRENNESHSIFQMPTDVCNKTPFDAMIDSKAKAYFFHNYSDLHGSSKFRKRQVASSRKDVGLKEREWYNSHHSSNSVNPYESNRVVHLPETKLVIAVHVRRGDVLELYLKSGKTENPAEFKHALIPCKTFGIVIRQLMRVVLRHGGIFSRLPVLVRVYSEGKQVNDEGYVHDISTMTKDFYDTDGTIRDEVWMEQEIRSSSVYKEKDENAEDLFQNGLEVTFHISEDTLASLHDMIAADVFIGSVSTFSKSAVTTLSRGIQLLPNSTLGQQQCCQTSFNSIKGTMVNMKDLEMYWGAYADANEGSVLRAYHAENWF